MFSMTATGRYWCRKIAKNHPPGKDPAMHHMPEDFAGPSIYLLSGKASYRNNLRKAATMILVVSIIAHDDVIKWKHFPRYLAICAVPGEFPAQRPVTRSFDVFFDLHPNKRLSKQWWCWWFETPPCPLRRPQWAGVLRIFVFISRTIYNGLQIFSSY